MFVQEITLNKFLLNYFEGLINDLPEDGLARRGAEKGHSALWLLGHLAVTGDSGRILLGHARICPPTWFVEFGPKSSDEIKNPDKYDAGELIDAVRRIYLELQRAAANADPDAMRQPHSVEILKGSKLVTNADVLAHLLTTHFALHAGQLSYWRRLQGKPALF